MHNIGQRERCFVRDLKTLGEGESFFFVVDSRVSSPVGREMKGDQFDIKECRWKETDHILYNLLSGCCRWACIVHFLIGFVVEMNTWLG